MNTTLLAPTEQAPDNVLRPFAIKEFLAHDARLGNRSRIADSGVSTWLERIDPDTIGLRYHATTVLTFHRDGRIIARTGGWMTATTKERINRQGVARVFQKGGEWFAHMCGDVVPFVDGMDLAAR